MGDMLLYVQHRNTKMNETKRIKYASMRVCRSLHSVGWIDIKYISI